MINKLRKKIVIFSISSIFIFLVLILLTINLVNVSLVSSNADKITEHIASRNGSFEMRGQPNKDGNFDNRPPMGPDSPEMADSLRYCTFSFDNDRNPTVVVYRLNALSQEEAQNLATSLLDKKVGWVNLIYRYRVYEKGNLTYVTLIDQGRELQPTFNIMIASIVGSLSGLLIVAVIMILLSKKLVQPLVQSDEKQKRFIASAALTLKTPITILSLDNGSLVKKYGEQDENKSIRQQVRRITDLANDLNSLAILEEIKALKDNVNLTNVFNEVYSRYQSAIENNRNVNLNIEENVILLADKGMMEKMLSEVVENVMKYGEKNVSISLTKENERILLTFVNDATGIPEGSLDTVFERFTRLDYKDHSQYDGNGVGLAIVKEIVTLHNGRVMALGKENQFILKIEF